MKNPLPSARRSMRWSIRVLRWTTERLRRREGSLSFHAERRGPFAREAEGLAGELGCILTDHLGPAAEALERALRRRAESGDDDPAIDAGQVEPERISR